MEWFDFAETWAIVILTYLLTSLFFLICVWVYTGTGVFWSDLDAFLIFAQLIGLGLLVGIPLLVYGLSQFKIVRRE